MAKRLEPESVIAIESVLKRKLHPREIESGVLDRQPAKATLPTSGMNDEELFAHVMSQPFDTGPFKPVAQSNDADPFASVVAEAEAAAELERVKTLPPAQRNLYETKAAQAQYAKENADKAAFAAHLTKYANELKTLNELGESVAADPYYTAEDIAAIHNAIAQIQFGPNGDEATTKKLLANVETGKGKVLQAKKDSLAAKLKEAGLDPSDIAAQIAKRFPDASKKARPDTKTPATNPALDALRDANGEPLWQGLFTKSKELRTALDALTADTNAKPEDVAAARVAWSSSVSAAAKANKEYEAAQAAATTDAGAGEGGAT